MTVYGLVDCNNFFVSCERVFRPALEGRPAASPVVFELARYASAMVNFPHRNSVNGAGSAGGSGSGNRTRRDRRPGRGRALHGRPPSAHTDEPRAPRLWPWKTGREGAAPGRRQQAGQRRRKTGGAMMKNPGNRSRAKDAGASP